jgi:methionyl-tRNA synthetase
VINFTERWLVTAALPYSNNLPHIGNIVGSHLPADIFTRFLRLFGEDVVFVGGTDEHGSPVEVAAFKQHITPQELTNRLYILHQRIYDWFGISYDNFSRTSNETNHKITQEIFLRLLNNGFITKKKLLLPYCPNDKRFLPDRWVEGTCPYCKFKGARGDQCENCGRLLDPQDLIDPYCVIDNTKPIFKEVEHLFLDLPKIEPQLLKWIKSQKHWKPNVKNTALSWIKEGLKTRSISRDLNWGISIPLEGYQNKVFYVWFEAPIGYISSTIEWAEKNRKNWKDYWQNETKIVHFLGKDNIVFHTITWPATLMGAGGFTLPYDVVGLEFLNYEGDKISKSRNWGIFLDYQNAVKVIQNENVIDVDPDVLRFYLALIMPETKDSNFVWKDFQEKINAELIGNFGNFVYRTLSFLKTNFNSVIPEPDTLSAKDKVIFKKISEKKKIIQQLIYDYKFRDALKEALELSAAGNKYFQDKKPWKILKSDPEATRNTLYVAVNLVRSLAIIFSPFVPFACEKIWSQLNLGNIFSEKWDDLDKTKLEPGQKIGKIEPLFKKFEVEEK